MEKNKNIKYLVKDDEPKFCSENSSQRLEKQTDYAKAKQKFLGLHPTLRKQ